jgi:protein-arginine kinase activator protein McsA
MEKSVWKIWSRLPEARTAAICAKCTNSVPAFAHWHRVGVGCVTETLEEHVVSIFRSLHGLTIQKTNTDRLRGCGLDSSDSG